MALAAVVLGLFAYGVYKRQQRQITALAEGNVPRNVSPATAAGVDIAKDIPSGNLPNAPVLREFSVSVRNGGECDWEFRKDSLLPPSSASRQWPRRSFRQGR